MERISSRVISENTDSTQLPPPPYTTVVYKLDENEFDIIPPPRYSDVGHQSAIYINNYPGPPLTDGHVQIVGDNISINHDIIIPKKIRIYLILNGIITILLGVGAVGIQIGIIVSNAIPYYYYGFWSGALIIGIGLSTVLLYNNPRRIDYSKLSHSFFWQMMLLFIIFIIGIVIIVTDTCNDNATNDNGNDQSCKPSHKIFNGFLVGIFASTLLQSIINAIVFGILKR